METQKVIINVGRQLGSGGRSIAKMLAQNFDYRFYDRELLNLAAQESGFSKRFFEQNDEQKIFTKSFFNYHLPFIGDNNFYSNNLSQERLFQFQSDAIRKAADKGGCVFVGRCADYILRDFNNVVNIFVTADLEVRIGRVCKRHQCEEKKAKAIIESAEERRAAYYNYYTGKQWGHSASYDLCVNSSLLGIEDTAKFLALFIRTRFNLEKI